VGLLSVAAGPVGVAITHYADVELLAAAAAIPVGLVLGVVAVRLARGARRVTQRTIGRVGGRRTAGTGAFLGGAGVYVSLAAAVAVGVYELLKTLSA
jgi:hypothetical protein